MSLVFKNIVKLLWHAVLQDFSVITFFDQTEKRSNMTTIMAVSFFPQKKLIFEKWIEYLNMYTTCLWCQGMIVLSDDPCSFLSACSARIMYQSYFWDFSWSSLAEVLTTQTYAQRGEIIYWNSAYFYFYSTAFSRDIFSIVVWLFYNSKCLVKAHGHKGSQMLLKK